MGHQTHRDQHRYHTSCMLDAHVGVRAIPPLPDTDACFGGAWLGRTLLGRSRPRRTRYERTRHIGISIATTQVACLMLTSECEQFLHSPTPMLVLGVHGWDAPCLGARARGAHETSAPDTSGSASLPHKLHVFLLTSESEQFLHSPTPMLVLGVHGWDAPCLGARARGAHETSAPD